MKRLTLEDYHCLKPHSDKDTKKWRKYDTMDFRYAYDKETLEKAVSYAYDNNLYNFVDPKVFKKFANSKEGRKSWQKSYGFLFANQVTGVLYKISNKSFDLTPCIKKCLLLEQTTFAKSCLRNGGLFKCCLRHWWLTPFEKARNSLIEKKLLQGKVTSYCNDSSELNKCHWCSMDAMCTRKDPITGVLKHYDFPRKTPLPKGNKPLLFSLYYFLFERHLGCVNYSTEESVMFCD